MVLVRWLTVLGAGMCSGRSKIDLYLILGYLRETLADIDYVRDQIIKKIEELEHGEDC